MKNVRLIDFRDICDPVNPSILGHLTPIEAEKDIPFEVKRVYYIHGVPGNVRRGFHSHRDLEQVLIAPSGPVTILVKTPFEEETYLLDKPWQGLYIGPMIWREMYNFTPGSTLFVLASHYYDEKDYIRDYSVYEPEATEYFSAENREK